MGRPVIVDRILQGLVLFLVVATALALGGVQVPVLMAFEWLCLAGFLLFVVRAAWVPPAYAYGSWTWQTGEVSSARRWTLFGHPLVSTRLGTPILVFIALVLFQLVPLPPSAIRVLSPGAAKLYQESLPGYATSGGVDFSHVESFLLGSGGDKVVDRILQAPGDAPAGLSLKSSNLRTISIYPYVTVRQLLVFLALLALFLVTVNVFSTQRRVEWILRSIVLFGFVLALFGIVQRLSWNGKIFWVVPVSPDASPFGPFVNHNHFAAFLAMIVPVAAGMLMDEGRRLFPARSGRQAGTPGTYAVHGPEPFARLLLAAFVVAVMAGAIAFSASRGAVLALTAAFIFYGGGLAVQGRIRRGEAVAGLLILVLAAGLSIWLGLGPLAKKLYAIGNVDAEPSLYSRVLGWHWTMKIVGDFPLLGTGFGTFAQAWTHYYPSGTAAIWHEAHNDYLQMLSETGVAGIVIFAAGFILFAWKYLLPGVLREDCRERYAVHGVAIGLLAAAFHSVVDFPLQITACAVLFVVLSALLISYRQMEEVSP